MEITVGASAEATAELAAEAGAEKIREALSERRRAVVAVAAGRSQIDLLRFLADAPGVDWGQVIVFPLDEFVGLSSKDAASFRNFWEERWVKRLPEPLAAFYAIDGAAADPIDEAVRMSRMLANESLDVSFFGIGENGHLAFNDPPADFDTKEPYLVVDLDERCRQQQVREGWFETIDEVPEEGISMSVRQLLSSELLIGTITDERKAEAVKAAVEGKITSQVPASILQEHESCQLFLDDPAASALSKRPGR